MLPLGRLGVWGLAPIITYFGKSKAVLKERGAVGYGIRQKIAPPRSVALRRVRRSGVWG